MRSDMLCYRVMVFLDSLKEMLYKRTTSNVNGDEIVGGGLTDT